MHGPGLHQEPTGLPGIWETGRRMRRCLARYLPL
jgi:hypothetical protein